MGFQVALKLRNMSLKSLRRQLLFRTRNCCCTDSKVKMTFYSWFQMHSLMNKLLQVQQLNPALWMCNGLWFTQLLVIFSLQGRTYTASCPPHWCAVDQRKTWRGLLLFFWRMPQVWGIQATQDAGNTLQVDTW